MYGKKTAKKNSRDKGSIMVLVALAMTTLIAFVGLTVDGGYIYLQYSKMHRAADAAALAAALQLPSVEDAKAQADEFASRSGFTNGVDDVRVTTFQKTDPNWVYVTVAKKQKMFFVTVLGIDHFDMEATAAAKCDYINRLPIESTGIFGVQGVQYLCLWGENIVASYGGSHSARWHDDGSVNPDYNEYGFDYQLSVPPDYAANNGTSLVQVDIYDADCWNVNDSVRKQDENPRQNIDQIFLKSDSGTWEPGMSTPYTKSPSATGRTVTTYTLFGPDGSKIADYVWDDTCDPAVTDLQWYSPPGFTIDASALGTGNYRINVSGGDGCSRNVFHLRSGPPLASKSGELSAAGASECAACDGSGRTPSICPSCNATGYMSPGRPCRTCSACAICGGDGLIMIPVAGGGGGGGAACVACAGTGKVSCVPCLGTGKVTCGTCGGTGMKNKVQLCGTCGGAKVVNCGVCGGSGGTACAVCGGSGAAAGGGAPPAAVLPPKYYLTWTGTSWDDDYEVAVVINSNDINWEQTQGTTTTNGSKDYKYDVTQYIAGDSGFVSFKNNNHVPPSKSGGGASRPPSVENMALVKYANDTNGDGKIDDNDTPTATIVDAYTGGSHDLGAFPEVHPFTGAGSDAGWGDDTQFDPFNGTSIKSDGIFQLMEFNRNSGQVNSTIGYIPEEYAGSTLTVKGVDNHNGKRWAELYDSQGNDFGGKQKPPQGPHDPIHSFEATLPDPYDGGAALYANFPAGSEARTTWLLGVSGSYPDGRRKIKLVE